MVKNADDKQGRRARLWVPGVVHLDDDRILQLGPEAGFNGNGEDFRAAHCHTGKLSDLRHRLWLVERSELSDEVIEEHAIILPHTLVDADAQPHARSWLEKQPLVCISGIKHRQLAEKGIRVYCVEHGVDQEHAMRIQAAGGDRTNWSLRLDLQQLVAELCQQLDLPDKVAENSQDVRTLLDRTLRQLSRKVLSEAAILNAFMARRLVEPGYGYRGATDGRAASVEQIAESLVGIEALFAQVDKRAAGQKTIARDVLSALRGLNEDEETVPIPHYDVARRIKLEARAFAMGDDSRSAPSWLVGGELREELQLPEKHLLTVENVALWQPKLPAEVRDHLSRERQIRKGAPNWLTPVLLAALLLFIAVALFKLT